MVTFNPFAPATGTANYGGQFGDGSDGAATLDGVATVAWASLAGSTYTMSRDCLLTSLTVNNAIILDTNGFRVFCQGTITNNGTISNAGNPGLANGTAGGITNSQSIFAGSPGGAGNTAAGSAGGANGAPMQGLVGAGSTGGTGSGGAGGAAGSLVVVAAGIALAAVRNIAPVADTSFGFNATTRILSGGTGGGGGGGDTTNKGGGGGSGGGILAILAHSVVNNGTLTAAGGNGGTPTLGNCGGGAGGGGGAVLVYTLSAWTQGTTTAAGGTGGGGVGTGTAGGNGAAGQVLNVIVS